MREKLTERQKRLKAEFEKERGYWSEEVMGSILKLDPDFFEAYLNFSAAPSKRGALPPKVREFIYIAINAATTHLYQPGIRLHIENALKYGATKEELMEVLEQVSALGIHACTVGVPILVEELKKANRKLASDTAAMTK